MRRFLLTAFLGVFLFTHTLAQQLTESRVFPVSVIDEEGTPYSGLKPEHVSAWVDKEPLKVISVKTENTPVDMGIVIDLSGSIGPPGKKESKEFRRKLNDAITRFLAVSHPENDYFATTFNERVAISENWTGPNDSLFEKLDAPANKGQTALYDALYFAIKNVTSGRHSRRVLLAITDGFDNESKRTFKEVAELIKRSDVIVYAIALYDKTKQGSSLAKEGLEVLDDLTELSGGRAVFVNYSEKPEVVKTAFEIIAADLQAQYQLTIENAKAVGPEKWRKLKLKLNLPEEKGRPKLWIRSRAGYYQ